MDILTKENLKELINEQGDVCVSIYMPTYRTGRETEQGPIRLRNLLKQVEQQLQTNGLRTPKIRAFLEPVETLLVNGDCWRYPSDGLALFLSSAGLIHYCLPLNFEELVIVSERFHIKPLLPLFAAEERFFVLALSQNAVRLLQGTRYSMDEIYLEDVPASMAQALRWDTAKKQVQFHAGASAPGGGGKRSALFQGHGVGEEDNKANILQYAHKINKGLQNLLRDEQAPLVLAGVEYLLSIYREANTYPNLANQGIKGNPDELSPDELHRRAWEILHPQFSQAQDEAISQYRHLSNTGSEQTSNDLEKILPAAFGGQVETLFVATGIQHWGEFDPQAYTVQVHKTYKPGDDDLLDLATVQTFLKGGVTYVLAPENMPEKSSIAAIFRY